MKLVFRKEEEKFSFSNIVYHKDEKEEKGDVIIGKNKRKWFVAKKTAIYKNEKERYDKIDLHI